MESRRLEIIVHSANDLKDVKHLGTIDPYVVVWIVGSDKVTKKCKTAVAKNTISPLWDCPMEFNIVPMKSNYVLFCDIQHDGTLLDRKIGEVHIPFTNLLVGDASGCNVRYPVKIPSGEVKGEIIISHKFLEPVFISETSAGKEVDNEKTHEKKKKTKKKKGKTKFVFFKPIGQNVDNQDNQGSASDSGSGSGSDSDVDDNENDEQDQSQYEDQSQDQDQGNYVEAEWSFNVEEF